jgi:Na+-driven multidrug efflux pump
MVIMIYTTAGHLVFCYILTITFGMGIDGPPAASTLSNFNGFVVTWLYISRLAKKNDEIKAAWYFPDKKCF